MDLDYENDFANEDEMAPIEVKRVPESQVADLSEEQLSETFTRVVTAADPNAAYGQTAFSHTEGEFKADGITVEHVAVHFQMNSLLIHSESAEAQSQQDFLAKKKDLEVKAEEESKGGEPSELANAVLGASGEMLLKNQFNFSARSTQTFNNSMRTKGIYTEPPPMRTFSFNVSQWDIFDTYLDDLHQKRIAAEMLEKKKPVIGGKKVEEEEEMAQLKSDDDKPLDLLHTRACAQALKKMERMVHTNSEADCFLAYKYLEDRSEAKKEDGRGSFFPLWRFDYKPVAKKAVTALAWNPEYADLFAVAFGSYDFNKQVAGTVCCFSLKNTSFPEYQFECDFGVTSLDFHPVHSSLLCIGMYNGGVAVYDIRTSDQPIFLNTDPTTKHTDPVWQVAWDTNWKASAAESADKPKISFFSISSDGRVARWILSKNELLLEEVVSLKLSLSPIEDEQDPAVLDMVGLAGGCSFGFNQLKNDLFVVGTEEGALQLYSKRYGAKFLRQFHGHHMAVYSVRWNKFHPKVFLSCSADWSVKLWEANESRPVMSFDLGTAVSDVEWAPFSSTVFAVITVDGKVRVFDLKVNKHEAVGEVRVRLRKDAKLTKVAFNPTEPIISVSDDQGIITIFKLSNNLRKMTAPSLQQVDPAVEIAKLEALMIMPEPEGDEEVNQILEQTRKVND